MHTYCALQHTVPNPHRSKPIISSAVTAFHDQVCSLTLPFVAMNNLVVHTNRAGENSDSILDVNFTKLLIVQSSQTLKLSLFRENHI